jgi:hypothetical protein
MVYNVRRDNSTLRNSASLASALKMWTLGCNCLISHSRPWPIIIFFYKLYHHCSHVNMDEHYIWSNFTYTLVYLTLRVFSIEIKESSMSDTRCLKQEWCNVAQDFLCRITLLWRHSVGIRGKTHQCKQCIRSNHLMFIHSYHLSQIHGHIQGFHLKLVAAEIRHLHLTLPSATFYVSRIKNV